ncbi:hypothetical protein EZV62_017980 [Acer yangbiense]|uniref:DNA2/NAM7 helicase helicase domain-containing protein n=1 Tax=Acer yangbiense TaxID=1000413 RepID=A0A5C7HI42_9ROSI|nr:hypothetical protein EZV62_017980 [Acer yangbiense]
MGEEVENQGEETCVVDGEDMAAAARRGKREQVKSSYMLHSVDMEPLSFLVIDEAAQLRESESTIPLQLPDIKHAILIGDECQLPAMVASNVSDEAGFGSLFERLSILGHSKQLPNIQVSSCPEEWRSQGIKHNYEMAAMCFERAGDPYWERRTKATGLKASADRLRSSNPEEANIILREAAEIFEAIGKDDSAAKCFFDLGEYERAGRIYLEKYEETELETAAKCFDLAGCYEQAAKVYARCNLFSKCLKICSKGKLFALGLQCIHSWKQHANTDVANTEDIYKAEQVFLESCARHFHEILDSKSMMKFVRTFHSMDMKRKFLKSLNCLNELMLLEEESGNFLAAASIAKQRGDILLAADLLQKAENFKEASELTPNTLPWSHAGTAEPEALPPDFHASPLDLDFTADDIMEEYSNMMINLGRFWEMVGALNLVEHEKYHMSIELNAPTIKVLVEITVRNHCTAKEFVGDEDEVQSVEAENMVEDLRQLLAALDVSELELKKNVSTIGELLKKLQLRKETMEPFLNSLFSRLYALMKSMDLIFDAEFSDSDDKGKMVGSKQENENKGKGKNKSKQKQKKNKGQKRK